MKEENQKSFIVNGLLYGLIVLLIFSTFIVFEEYQSDNPDYVNIKGGIKAVSLLLLPIATVILGLISASLSANKEKPYRKRVNRSSIIIGLILYSVFFMLIFLKSIQ